MLFIVFQLADDRYALEARELVEVLPLARIKRLPRAPAGIAGLLDYHGATLPVVDLSELALGRAAAQRLSTRLLIVEIGEGRRLALVAERANEMLRRDPADFVATPVAPGAAPYLGPVARDARGLVQWIAPRALLTAGICEALFAQIEESA
jgi:chemotaxis-related protein WspB